MNSKHPVGRRIGEPGYPSASDVASKGQTWGPTQVTDEYLVGHTTIYGGTDAGDQIPAVTEMVRRLKESISEFNRAMGDQTASLKTAVAENTEAVNRFNKSSTRLAWILFAVGVLQVIIAGLQLFAAAH